VHSLAELEVAFADALLDSRAPDVAAMVAGDGVPPEARVAIYRHHVLTSLTAALRSTYPVVCRLVGDRFFAYAAHEFIGMHPPTGPCLFEYGADFAAFLETYPACRDLAYLPDVARLEWALNRALHAEDTVRVYPGALRSLDLRWVESLRLGFDPSVTLLSSPWPIDAIWRANQPGADPEATVDATRGPVRLEIRRLGDDGVFRRLTPATHAFRRALIEAETLATAADQAGAVDGEFDITAALHELFTDDVLIGFRVTPGPEGTP
jgi:Putative DNA-binding domain